MTSLNELFLNSDRGRSSRSLTTPNPASSRGSG